MKDKIIQILEANSGWADLNGRAVYMNKWEQVAEEINNMYLPKDNRDKKQVEKDFLAMFNRIKAHHYQARGKRFLPTRTVSKPSQLHARLKDFSMDELGKVITNAFKDNYHIDTHWQYVTTEYVTRPNIIERFLK